jgi:hypothetical protein
MVGRHLGAQPAGINRLPVERLKMSHFLRKKGLEAISEEYYYDITLIGNQRGNP